MLFWFTSCWKILSFVIGCFHPYNYHGFFHFIFIFHHDYSPKWIGDKTLSKLKILFSLVRLWVCYAEGGRSFVWGPWYVTVPQEEEVMSLTAVWCSWYRGNTIHHFIIFFEKNFKPWTNIYKKNTFFFYIILRKAKELEIFALARLMEVGGMKLLRWKRGS